MLTALALGWIICILLGSIVALPIIRTMRIISDALRLARYSKTTRSTIAARYLTDRHSI